MTNDRDNASAPSSYSANVRLAGAAQDAVRRLIERSTSLKSKVNQLQKENESLRDDLAAKTEEVSRLQQQLESCRLGLALRDSSAEVSGYTREEAKRRIVRMVREIDECIALLKR